MAQGLRCPNCGHKHPVSQLAGTATFRCAGCGQVLKTPREYRSAAPTSTAASRAARPATERPRPPSPRPRPAAAPAPAPAPEVEPTRVASRRPSDATEALPSVAPPPRPRSPRTPPPATPARAPGGPGAPAPLPWPWRALVWLVAVPLGLFVTALPARWLGVLNGNSLFDVISGTGIGRYLRVFAIAPFAALVIATLAHVSLERLPVILARRRAAARAGARPGPAGAGSANGRSGPAAGASGPDRTAQRAGRGSDRRSTS